MVVVEAGICVRCLHVCIRCVFWADSLEEDRAMATAKRRAVVEGVEEDWLSLLLVLKC